MTNTPIKDASLKTINIILMYQEILYTNNHCHNAKKLVSMIRNYHNHTLQTNPQHCVEEPGTLTVTRQPFDKNSKATSPLSLFKMIAKLERTQSKVYRNKNKHRTSTTNGKYIKQQINNNRADDLEQTAA